MVAIRQIIAVGCLLTLGGLLASSCGTRLPYAGDWVGTVELPPGPATPADETLKTVKLNIKDDGKYVLIVKSIPYEGRMDLTAKTQVLEVEYVMGRSVDRMGPGGATSYTVTWNADNSIGLTDGAGLSVALHRNPKPSAS
jgi:hypothetical protein